MQSDSVCFGPAHPRGCLTHKRVGEVAPRRATVGTARAASAMQTPMSRSGEELVDAKAPPGKSPEAARDEAVEAPKTGAVRCGDVERSRMAPMSVLTTVAQVRAALRAARETGLDDVVVCGRCSRCGREGRVVHFDGELRARARAP